jgi:hypothetical protein
MFDQSMSNVFMGMACVRPEGFVEVLGDTLNTTLVELFHLVSLLHVFKRFINFFRTDIRAGFQTLDIASFSDRCFDCGLVIFQNLGAVLKGFLDPYVSQAG